MVSAWKSLEYVCIVYSYMNGAQFDRVHRCISSFVSVFSKLGWQLGREKCLFGDYMWVNLFRQNGTIGVKKKVGKNM